MNGHGCRVPSPASDDVLYKGKNARTGHKQQSINHCKHKLIQYVLLFRSDNHLYTCNSRSNVVKQANTGSFKFIYCNHVRPFQVFSMFSVHPQSQITYLCFRKKTYTNHLSFFILLVYPNLGSNGKTKQI